MSSRGPLQILFLALEFPDWGTAHHVSYSSQLSLEEGLLAQGAQVTTITAPWFSRARELCRGRKFDQVWIEIARVPHMEANFLEWVAELAPIRIGLLVESLDYTPEECAVNPQYYNGVKTRVEARMPYMTHLVAVDEKTVQESLERGQPAMWWPQAVPKRFIRHQQQIVSDLPAVFCGSVYGERIALLGLPEFKGKLVHQSSPEKGTADPYFFRGLHLATQYWWRRDGYGAKFIYPFYLAALRRIRWRGFSRWLGSMEEGSAIVNLPACVKAYAGRVVEGMAAERPVISWEISERPRTKALFEDGKEILLYARNNPAQLLEQIERVLGDRNFARGIAANAQLKVQSFHTTEKRVDQILKWVESGEEPIFS